MPIIKAQCENCQSILEVDSGKKTAICPFCGTQYIIENAIHQTINNISAGSVHIKGNTEELERLAEAAEKFVGGGMIDDAEAIYNEMREKFRFDYRGFWGYVQRRNSRIMVMVHVQKV